MSIFQKTVMPGNRFAVYIGPVKLGFSKVQGLKQSLELTPIREGGVNDRVHMLPSSAQQNGRVIFERGWYGSLTDALAFRPGALVPEGIGIEIFNSKGKTAGLIYLIEPIIESWELTDLSASDSSIVIRRLSVFHSGIEEAPMGI